MAKVRAKRRLGPDDGQLSLPFERFPVARLPRSPIASAIVSGPQPVRNAEVIAPSDPSGSPEWTAGEREHALLVHQADKYEARLYAAMKAFIIAVVFDVAVNGGLPVAKALLQRYDLPPLNDSMLSGVCGLAAIAFACAMVYYYARFRACSFQLWLDLNAPKRVKHDWARWLALTLGGAWLGVLGMMFALVLYLSAGDAMRFLRGVAWHIAPTEWITETNPSP